MNNNFHRNPIIPFLDAPLRLPKQVQGYSYPGPTLAMVAGVKNFYLFHFYNFFNLVFIEERAGKARTSTLCLSRASARLLARACVPFCSIVNCLLSTASERISYPNNIHQKYRNAVTAAPAPAPLHNH